MSKSKPEVAKISAQDLVGARTVVLRYIGPSEYSRRLRGENGGLRVGDVEYSLPPIV